MTRIKPCSDGLALKSICHPQPVWYKRAWSWLVYRPHFTESNLEQYHIGAAVRERQEMIDRQYEMYRKLLSSGCQVMYVGVEPTSRKATVAFYQTETGRALGTKNLHIYVTQCKKAIYHHD